MPVSAPTVDDTPNYYRVTMRYIDAVGDTGSFAVDVPQVTYTALSVQAYVDALGVITNADIYEVQVTALYKALPLKGNATDAIRVSKDDVITNLFKSVYNDSRTMVVPAPITALFETDTETPDTTNVSMAAAVVAFDVMIEGASGQFDWVSSRFTERTEKNQAVRP